MVVVLIFVVYVLLAHEVFGAFVLVSAAILGKLLASSVAETRRGRTYVLIASDGLVNVA